MCYLLMLNYLTTLTVGQSQGHIFCVSLKVSFHEVYTYEISNSRPVAQTLSLMFPFVSF